MTSAPRKTSLFVIFLTVFIDLLGFGMVLPLLPFYAERLGRPSIPPGVYFRMLLIGYFEGIDSERGIAWRWQYAQKYRQIPTPRGHSQRQ